MASDPDLRRLAERVPAELVAAAERSVPARAGSAVRLLGLLSVEERAGRRWVGEHDAARLLGMRVGTVRGLVGDLGGLVIVRQRFREEDRRRLPDRPQFWLRRLELALAPPYGAPLRPGEQDPDGLGVPHRPGGTPGG